MHVYEVITVIYKFFPQIFSLKTYSTGYFRKQQDETGYFCGMSLEPLWYVVFHEKTSSVLSKIK